VVNWGCKVRALVLLFQFAVFTGLAQPVFQKSISGKPDLQNLRVSTEGKLTKSGIRVFVSLSEVCMLSRYYARVLEKMRLRFPEMAWIGVFPNPFSTDSSIRRFARNNHLKFTLCRDSAAKFTQSVGWKVTPEVVVLGPENEVLYKGRIDDFYVEIGRHKSTTSQHFLKTALSSLQNGQKPIQPFVPPVGCVIDFRLWENQSGSH
jgi:hypothetical protein